MVFLDALTSLDFKLDTSDTSDTRITSDTSNTRITCNTHTTCTIHYTCNTREYKSYKKFMQCKYYN